MCGIFGWISFDENKKSGNKKLFCRLMKLSARRGKDASGVWLWDGEKEKHLVLPTSGEKLIKSEEFNKNILKLKTLTTHHKVIKFIFIFK